MPIRLNLLAETQAAEEMRRRDPAKRLLLVSALLIAAMLVWAGSLQVRAIASKMEYGRLEAQLTSKTNQYQQALSDQKKLAETKSKLTGLEQLTMNRFLNGTLLNALQQATIDDVALLHVKVEQTYTLSEAPKETKGRTNAPAKPQTVKEKIVVTLDGKDSSPSGDHYNKYKEALSANPYFQDILGKTNEVTLKSFIPAVPATDPGKNFVQFALECRLVEKTR